LSDIVKAHGGEIKVDTRESGGSELLFNCELIKKHENIFKSYFTTLVTIIYRRATGNPTVEKFAQISVRCDK
jgi:hypothetical protein